MHLCTETSSRMQRPLLRSSTIRRQLIASVWFLHRSMGLLRTLISALIAHCILQSVAAAESGVPVRLPYNPSPHSPVLIQSDSALRLTLRSMGEKGN